MVRLLAVSGSLCQASSNSVLLRAAERLCPEGILVAHYEGIGELPHFNPDLLEDPPEAVIELRSIIGSARIIEEASMTANLLSSRLSAEGIATDPVMGPLIGTALGAVKRHLDNQNL